MRLSILPVLVIGAGIVNQVGAKPLRVLVERPSNANIRCGHVLANANANGNDDSDSIVRLVPQSLAMTTSTEVKGKHHFCSASLKVKALRMLNAFRHALGLPLIEMGHHDTFKGEGTTNPSPVSGEVWILPMPLFGTPITPDVSASSFEEEIQGMSSFFLTNPSCRSTATMKLNLAFVLGYGIGVLLRMFCVRDQRRSATGTPHSGMMQGATLASDDS